MSKTFLQIAIDNKQEMLNHLLANDANQDIVDVVCKLSHIDGHQDCYFPLIAYFLNNSEDKHAMSFANEYLAICNDQNALIDLYFLLTGAKFDQNDAFSEKILEKISQLD